MYRYFTDEGTGITTEVETDDQPTIISLELLQINGKRPRKLVGK